MAQENDIVLIYFEGDPLSFARIEEITPDIKRDWYHVKLLVLQIPLQVTTWILRDAYIDGEEFTMNGKRMRMEKVVCPELPQEDELLENEEEAKEEKDVPKETGKIISFASRKKK